MNKSSEKKQYLTIKWSIDNFSYWNNEIHDKVIETESFCLSSGTPLKIELYPRGPSGREEHLLVRVHGIQDGFSGDLSFIGSDGSLICNQQVDEEKESTFIELPPGPKFDDVVAEFSKNEVIHKDQLTLRLRKRHLSEEDHRMFTMIDVFNTSVRISTKIFKSFDSITSASLITKFEHPLDDGRMGRMSLRASKDELGGYKMELALEPTSSEENVFVLTCMSLLTAKNELIRTEENENVIRDDCKEWTFSNSLKKKDLTGKDYTLFIRFKMIPNNKYKHRCGTLSCHPGEVIAMPTESFPLLGLSVPGERSSKSTEPPTSPRPESALKVLNISPEPEDALKVLAREYWHLYRNQDFSDIQLRSCEDVSFETHRGILSARSPVFKSMLQKTSDDILDFPDMDANTLGHFLMFLYSGTLDSLPWQSAFKLYSAAEKYQVPTLKRKCVTVLCKTLAISNAHDIRSLAEKHGNDELKSAVEIFMLQNYEYLRKDPEDRIRVF